MWAICHPTLCILPRIEFRTRKKCFPWRRWSAGQSCAPCGRRAGINWRQRACWASAKPRSTASSSNTRSNRTSNSPLGKLGPDTFFRRTTATPIGYRSSSPSSLEPRASRNSTPGIPHWNSRHGTPHVPQRPNHSCNPLTPRHLFQPWMEAAVQLYPFKRYIQPVRSAGTLSGRYERRRVSTALRGRDAPVWAGRKEEWHGADGGRGCRRWRFQRGTHPSGHATTSRSGARGSAGRLAGGGVRAGRLSGNRLGLAAGAHPCLLDETLPRDFLLSQAAHGGGTERAVFFPCDR